LQRALRWAWGPVGSIRPKAHSTHSPPQAELCLHPFAHSFPLRSLSQHFHLQPHHTYKHSLHPITLAHSIRSLGAQESSPVWSGLRSCVDVGALWTVGTVGHSVHHAPTGPDGRRYQVPRPEASEGSERSERSEGGVRVKAG